MLGEPQPPIPEATLGRLSLYLRIVEELAQQGILAVESQELARRAQVQPFLVRKDLAYCGRLGRRGQGYAVRLLQRTLSQLLGQNRRWNYIIVGLDELGAALTRFPWPTSYVCVGLFEPPQAAGGFAQYSTSEGVALRAAGWSSGARRFEVPALPSLLPSETQPASLPPVPRQLSVQPLGALGEFVRENAVDLAMLCAPPAQALLCAQAICDAGIGSILNFTGRSILAAELQQGTSHLQEGRHEERDTVIENVDFVLGLHRLAVRTLLNQQ